MMKMEIVFANGEKNVLSSIASFNVVEETCENQVQDQITAGELFEVNPLSIDATIFEHARKNRKQEWTRLRILEALAVVCEQPEKYAKPFWLLVPDKKWEGKKTGAELKQYAKDCGGYMSIWVEQALGWAQRLSNGESWGSVCNDIDRHKWYRMIVWKNGLGRIVGYSKYNRNFTPSTYVSGRDYDFDEPVIDTVPLVTIRR